MDTKDKDKKIRLFLAKLFLALVFVVVFVNFFWLTSELKRIKNDIYKYQSEVTKKVESDLKFILISKSKLASQQLSFHPFVKQLIENSSYKINQEQIDSFLNKNPELIEFSIIDYSGKEIFKYSNGRIFKKSLLRNVTTENYFVEALKNGEFVGVVYDNNNFNHNIITARKVIFENNFGIVFAKFDTKKELNGYAKNLLSKENKKVFIIDSYGYILDHYDSSKISLNVASINKNFIDLVERLKTTTERFQGKSIAEYSQKGDFLPFAYYNKDQEKIQAMAQILKPFGLAVVFEENYFQIWKPWWSILIFSVAGISLFTLVSLLLVRNIFNSIYYLDELKRKNKQVELILYNLVDGVILYDDKFVLKFINPEACRILGVKEEDVIGKQIKTDVIKENKKLESLVKVLYPLFAEGFKRIPKGDNEKRGAKSIELSIEYPQKRDLYITTVPIKTDKNKIEFIKVIRDISREKNISKTKSEFISIAAHQLRTPLSAIKWIFKMLIDGDAGSLTDEQKEFVRKGYEANERIINLVNDMLNVARIEEGRFGYEFYYVNLIDLIEKAIKGFMLKAEEKNIQLVFKKPKFKLDPIKVDPSRISLVLENLIDNALKYTNRGGKVEVSLKKAGDFVEVCVKDNGVGISNEDKEKIFSKFFRGSKVVKMQTEGTGLGLFITRNIVLRHGGQIWFESEEGKGTEFHFTLPIDEKLIPKS